VAYVLRKTEFFYGSVAGAVVMGCKHISGAISARRCTATSNGDHGALNSKRSSVVVSAWTVTVDASRLETTWRRA